MPGRKKTDPDKQSVRVNVGVTKECVAKIDELMEASHVFNSRSDFINAALRCLCFKYADVAGMLLTEAEGKHAEPRAVMGDFDKSMNTIGHTLDGRFRERFGETVTVQVAIRMNPAFYDRIVGMSALSPGGIQPLARMAIVDYCKCIESEIETANRLFERTGKLAVSEPSEQDAEAVLAQWDELTSGIHPACASSSSKSETRP